MGRDKVADVVVPPGEKRLTSEAQFEVEPVPPEPVNAFMSPTQELLNAVTMLPTACMSLHMLLFDSASYGDAVLAAAILMHFPFSFVYHTHCAMRHGSVHPVENNVFLKLDLAFIHISGSFIALATSGSVLWFSATFVFNLFSVYRTMLWRNTVLERRVCRFLCAVCYIAPIITVSATLFMLAMFAFITMALPFVLNQQLKGWGHSLSHLLLVPYVVVLFAAT